MRVLFVCIQNTCRRVVAEAVFNKLSKGFAESAGVDAGDEFDEKAIEVLKKFGYDVVKRKPRSLDEVDLSAFDIVIAVCEESKCIMIDHPRVERWYIDDPKGKSEEEYIKTLRIIERKVKELLEKLKA